MIGLKAKQKRFSLYFLEENELYTQDLSGFCIISDNETQKERFIRFCSLSKLKNLLEKKKEKSTSVPEASFSSLMTLQSQYINISIVI